MRNHTLSRMIVFVPLLLDPLQAVEVAWRATEGFAISVEPLAARPAARTVCGATHTESTPEEALQVIVQVIAA